jgi:hypothetical protein
MTQGLTNQQFVSAVSKLVGFDTPPPDQIRQYIELLKQEGYSTKGAAGQLRQYLAVNSL